MNNKVLNPGEIWSFKDTAGKMKEALVVGVFDGEYVNYVLCHPYKKADSNLKVIGKSGVSWIDPRKLIYTHASQFMTMNKVVPDNEMMIIRAAVLNHFGDDVEELAELEGTVRTLQQSLEAMRGTLKEKDVEIRTYKTLCENGLTALCDKLGAGETTTTTTEPVKPTKSEIEAERRKENKKKYAAVQGYIAVKCKAVGMTLSTLDKLTGHVNAQGVSTGAISHWARGDSPANWAELERIFPGIQAEAVEWAKNQAKGA